MASHVLLLSIRPKYSQKIFDETKKVELRRVRPRLLNEGDLVLVYVSSPHQVVLGSFNVEKIVELTVTDLWKQVENNAGVTSEEFYNYYQGASVGIGIFIKNVQRFIHPIKLEALRSKISNFSPPQSFRYLTEAELGIVNYLGQYQEP